MSFMQQKMCLDSLNYLEFVFISNYLESIKGIGFKKAVKLVYESGSDDTFLQCMSIL